MFGIGRKKRARTDMRDMIERELAHWGLGKLVAVVGPKRGGRDEDEDWYKLSIKYRIDPDQDHLNDGRIEVVIGYDARGGYWNRRCIRVAIEREGKKIQRKTEVEQTWARSQLAITDGRESDGAFAL